MKRFGTASMAAVFLAFGVAASGVAADAPDSSKPAWKINGTLEESCSCSAACPCWFGSKPTKSQCSGGMALFIKKGTYGKTALDGLGIAGVMQSPEGKSMAESMGNMNFNEIYIDEKASPDQRKALEAIAAETMPLAKPENTHVHYTPVSLKVTGAEHAVSIGSVGQWSGHLMAGGYKGAPKIVNPPGADPFHKEYLQGITTQQTYGDAAQWSFNDTNYMYTTFDVTSADMKQYTAAMEDMMKSMKH